MRWIASVLAGVALTALATPAFAAPRQVRVPLHNGKIHTPDLAKAVCAEMHLPRFDIAGGDIDVSGLRGVLFVQGLNAALGEGCHLSVERDAMVLSIDVEKLPKRLDDAERSVRTFTAAVAPEATARQARHWGLFLPKNLDPQHPLIVLVHGLDAEKESMGAMAALMQNAGYQVAYFSYPDDQPIEESAKLFARHLSAVHEQFPTITIDIVAHSMGGLVARDYIEGSGYAGGIDRLILVGTPNAGSGWARYRFLLEAQEQFHQWKSDPEYSWTWSITDGLGEAGRDLKPHSRFLDRLNAMPRRTGVRYTIIAGSQSAVSRYSAGIADSAAHCLPKKAQGWWGIRQCEKGVADCAQNLRNKTGSDDGPVSLESARLAGVDDVVIVKSDHETLICPDHGNPPGAWKPILERLSK